MSTKTTKNDSSSSSVLFGCPGPLVKPSHGVPGHGGPAGRNDAQNQGTDAPDLDLLGESVAYRDKAAGTARQARWRRCFLVPLLATWLAYIIVVVIVAEQETPGMVSIIQKLFLVLLASWFLIVLVGWRTRLKKISDALVRIPNMARSLYDRHGPAIMEHLPRSLWEPSMSFGLFARGPNRRLQMTMRNLKSILLRDAEQGGSDRKTSTTPLAGLWIDKAMDLLIPLGLFVLLLTCTYEVSMRRLPVSAASMLPTPPPGWLLKDVDKTYYPSEGASELPGQNFVKATFVNPDMPLPNGTASTVTLTINLFKGSDGTESLLPEPPVRDELQDIYRDSGHNPYIEHWTPCDGRFRPFPLVFEGGAWPRLQRDGDDASRYRTKSLDEAFWTRGLWDARASDDRHEDCPRLELSIHAWTQPGLAGNVVRQFVSATMENVSGSSW